MQFDIASNIQTQDWMSCLTERGKQNWVCCWMGVVCQLWPKLHTRIHLPQIRDQKKKKKRKNPILYHR